VYYNRMNAYCWWYAAASLEPYMRLQLKWQMLALAMGLTMVVPIAAPHAEEDPRSKQLNSILRKAVHPGQPGLAVLVKKDGHAVFERGYGLGRIGGHEPIAADTDFRLASVTKQFTAMAVMLLVHDGKLSYETTLIDIFPEFPAYGKTITVRHLLTHTAGLPDYEDLMDKMEKANGKLWSAEHQIQDDEVLSLLEKETRGKFAPGSSWAYSNSGYVVLGLIVARVSRVPYPEFLERRIFAPLQMRNTLAYQKGKKEIPHRAFGHSRQLGKLALTDQSSTSATLGDGGVYSNLEDLSRWDDALANHTLLSGAEMQPALAPVKLADGREPHWPVEPDSDNLAPGKPVSYGFGWFLDAYPGHPRMWHSGTTIGFRNIIERFTLDRDRLTIVILCNRADFDPAALALKIFDLYVENAK
jgi:CubicO group peptidase (beta-lactamase class C family)